MIPHLRPAETVETVFDIDFERLRFLGKQALVFDFDNTLAKRGCRAMPTLSNELLGGLAATGFHVGILTNRRPRRTIAGVSFPIIYHAGKPWRTGYLAILEMLASSPEQGVMIGDRYLTDILGANRLGIHSVRVRSLGVE